MTSLEKRCETGPRWEPYDRETHPDKFDVSEAMRSGGDATCYVLAYRIDVYNYIINPSSQVEKAHTHFTDCMRKVLSGLESISTTKLCTGE